MHYDEDNGYFRYILAFIGICTISAVSYFLYQDYQKRNLNIFSWLGSTKNITGHDINTWKNLSDVFGVNVSNIDNSDRIKLGRIANLAISEPCDWPIISQLSESFEELNMRRNAALLYEYYDRDCQKANVATWRAANIYTRIGDHQSSLRAIERYIQDTAENPNGYFLRARSHEELGNSEHAISDYLTAMSLLNDLSRTSYSLVRRLSRLYEAEGMYCEAASTLQVWASANPDRDSNEVNYLIQSIRQKGQCANNYASGEEVFRHSSGTSGVIYADVLVNGQKGRFIVDTGAGMVSLSKSFAQRLRLNPARGTEVLTNTANGIAYANRVSLNSVQIGSVKEEHVQGMVMQKEDAFPEDLDGLLGRSFLSRFDVSFEKSRWKISSRK